MRILVAETDSLFLDEMKQALVEAGYEVTTFTDGMRAWDCLVGPAPPDLVITRLDLGSGKPPGTALGLYAQSCHPRIPVIYVPAGTGRAEHADPGHGAVLVKPFPITDLVKTAHRLLGK
jgi:DNA-binding response OmpR family regulator